MATKFLEPGGDADFLVGTTNGFWKSTIGSPTIVTDFVHGSHLKSIKYRPGNQDVVTTKDGVLADAGSRFSIYIYLVTLPSATVNIIRAVQVGGLSVFTLKLTSTGILQLRDGGGSQLQLGTNLRKNNKRTYKDISQNNR